MQTSKHTDRQTDNKLVFIWKIVKPENFVHLLEVLEKKKSAINGLIPSMIIHFRIIIIIRGFHSNHISYS